MKNGHFVCGVPGMETDSDPCLEPFGNPVRLCGDDDSVISTQQSGENDIRNFSAGNILKKGQRDSRIFLSLYIAAFDYSVYCYLCAGERQKDWIGTLIVPYFYCVAGAASVMVLILSPVVLGKSWILAVCFMMIAVGEIYREIEKDGYYIEKFL